MTEQTKTSLNLRKAFDQGVAVAIDPANNVAIQQGGEAITTLNSYWLHQRCPVCSHTFRLGDEVYIAEDRTVRHNNALLPCAQGNATGSEPSPETSAFFAGLDTAWPPPKDMPIVRLEAGHELLAPPLAGFQRHTCVVCGHTLRLNDHVVICPCSPHKPLCRIAVHRDLIHGLHCFDAWNPGANGQLYCPVTSRKLDG
ncbi:hypothetical protein [Moorena sp. SIO4G3]|uniref:hypothetical protein n=1 Tax=Moorena sp. SIO4G3 TaxID=2607821 RepID=UPI00142B18C6|nr:hypothetical protein [Moorena sp. SIO4G3]NEO75337.1 hypothetical protein [Moorena sp. SIO4G3]